MAEQLPSLSESDLRFIQEAADYLENPRLLMRIANLVGKPAEALLQRLPQSAQQTIGEATHTALETGLRWAARTLPNPGPQADAIELPPGARAVAQRLLGQHGHTAVAATTGAVGGFFGFAGMTFEAPATTMVMLRSIARVANEEGFRLEDPQTRIHCLAVLGIGAETLSSMESTYLASRIGLALAMRDAAAFMAKHTAGEVAHALSKGTAPVLVRLINRIAAPFQIVLSQKFAAQSVPVAGAAMGALINAAFTDHFNRVARYHFGILRLENQYGKELVQSAYARSVAQRRQVIE